MRGSQEAEDAELQSIVGKEKFEKLQAIRAESQAKMKERMEKRKGPRNGNGPVSE